MSLTREAGFGPEVKRRIMIGTYALSSGYYDAYYGQAQKVRTLIARDFAAAFEQADVLVSPTSPFVAFGIGERVDDPMAMYINDLCTLPASLAGTPAISVPCGLSEGLPVGLQIMAPTLADERCYRVGAAFEAAVEPRPRLDPGAERDDALTYDDVAVAAYEPVIGLETHVELGTASKMFCGCSTEFGAEPNTHTCPVCLGLPGALPVANEAAIESTIKIGLALNCSIAAWCRFARKNYFYPDMPKNFQTSQYDEPLCVEGYLDVEVDGETVPRRHRARAPGRGHRQEHPRRRRRGRIHGADYSLVDYNRAGIPLVEIVTKPVPGTGALAPEVAKAYVTELRDILRTLGVSDVRMEQGSLRCDVNTSLNRPGRRVGHPDRDQERQLAAQRRAGGALGDHPAGRPARRGASGSSRRPGTSPRRPATPVPAAARKRRPTTATSPSPTWCRSRRTPTGSRRCAPGCPSCRPPAAPGARSPRWASTPTTCSR